MSMPKPSDTSKALFESLVPDDALVTVRPMFGNVAAFVNGNMFMGLSSATTCSFGCRKTNARSSSRLKVRQASSL